MILVDFSQLCVAAYAVGMLPHADVHDDLDVFRHMILNSLRKANSKFAGDYGQMVIAVDAKRNWRKEVFPYYKQNREAQKAKSPINFTVLKQHINAMVNEIDEFLPYPVIRVDYAEADDVIGTIVRSNQDSMQPTLIISGDKDYIQLQAGNEFLRQWDNVHDKWITDNNPRRYMFEHIIKGDRGDGIPNIFSPDDHFITPQGKAKPIRGTMLDQWWENGIDDIKDLPGLKRNKRLIDLNKTPETVKEAILKTAAEKQPKSRNGLLNYFISRNLRQLAQQIGEF